MKMADQEIIQEIGELGISQEVAEEMLDTFTNQGGLACLQRWRAQFSLFHRDKNVYDILFKAGRVL